MPTVQKPMPLRGVRVIEFGGLMTFRHPLNDVVAALERAEVPVAKIYTAADIHADPHFRHRGMIEPVVLPDGMAVGLPGIVPHPARRQWMICEKRA